ncbi:MAG TPA: hypothetical protein DHU63_02395 [Candidatus Marinimicrobia bacterium]|nr:MAG: hypothetical protein AUJ47_05680 [Candidatus Marinimicrobia bacterium CG1_02_48_14]PJA54161.1 MAG: hypothetical protein CO167_05395 [Candidatus Marinimicrobia bacterium CG_4_9_14_3_um_filter_48_9]HCW75370.1 hypothetical protein [Candidatus Neomarinimicrobiota bacterium]
MFSKTSYIMSLILSIGFSGASGQPDLREVSGTILLETPVERKLHSLSPYARTRYGKTTHTKSKPNEITEVVLFIPQEQLPTTLSLKPDTFSIKQHNLQLIPHILVIPVGSVVNFPNHDNVFHNIFSLSPTKRFDLGRYPEGESRSVTFDEPGVVKVFCDIHAEMNALIYVIDTPLYTRPNQAGEFSLSSIPPGKYDLHIWHDILGEQVITIDLAAGDLNDLTIKLSN